MKVLKAEIGATLQIIDSGQKVTNSIMTRGNLREIENSANLFYQIMEAAIQK